MYQIISIAKDITYTWSCNLSNQQIMKVNVMSYSSQQLPSLMSSSSDPPLSQMCSLGLLHCLMCCFNQCSAYNIDPCFNPCLVSLFSFYVCNKYQVTNSNYKNLDSFFFKDWANFNTPILMVCWWLTFNIDSLGRKTIQIYIDSI